MSNCISANPWSKRFLQGGIQLEKNPDSLKVFAGLFSERMVVKTRICAAEMAVRYAALSACRKVHVCHCNSLGGAT